jgi:hypothetical protein
VIEILAALGGIQVENVLRPLVPNHQLLFVRAVLQPAPLVNADLVHVFFVWQGRSPTTHIEGTLGSLRDGGTRGLHLVRCLERDVPGSDFF